MLYKFLSRLGERFKETSYIKPKQPPEETKQIMN